MATIFDLNIWEPIQLMIGDRVLGDLHTYETDQPFVHCNFEPAPAFEEFREHFETALSTIQTADLSEWKNRQAKIDSLGLFLVSADKRTKVRSFLIHINGDKAQFRDWQVT